MFSDARQVVTRLTTSGRMTDAIAFIRDLVPHQLVEEELATAYPDGMTVPDAMAACVRFPWRAVVTTSFDDLWERALNQTTGIRRPPAGPDRGRRSRPGAVARAAADSPVGPGRLPREPLPGTGRRARSTGAVGGARLAGAHGAAPVVRVRRLPPHRSGSGVAVVVAGGAPAEAPHFLFLDVSTDPDADTEVSVWALKTGFEVIPCLEGTAEGVERLATIATSIAAQLPPLDIDIDFGIWLEKWAQDPGNPQPREVLMRVETALREDERWDRLIELLLRRLDLQEEEEEQLAALSEVARIFREKLAAPARALTPGIAMLRLRPTDDELWENLRGGRGGGQGVGAAGEPGLGHRAGGGTDAGGGAHLARAGAGAAREPRPSGRRAGRVPRGAGRRSGGSRDARRRGGSAARARTLAGAGRACCTRRRTSPTIPRRRSRTCWK